MGELFPYPNPVRMHNYRQTTFIGGITKRISRKMPIKKNVCGMDQEGLSEVIGFVLILGLITVALSLYLIYGVPAQGRENEIVHMGVVKDQFSEYKVGLDSLFTNNLLGTTIGNSFSLGTSGGYTQGSNSIFPIMSPVSSGGIFTINRRTTLPETLQITSYSLVTGNGSTSVALPAQVSYTPSHVYVNISNIQPSDLNQNRVFGVTANTAAWNATINLTPRSVHYNETQTVNCPMGGGACTISYREGERYTNTDITLSVAKGGILTMQDTIVYRNISPYTVYSIDLMDDVYGLKSSTLPPQYISLTTEKPLGFVTATGNIAYDFSEQNYTHPSIPLGAISYRADNYYWIIQTYYYQMGGVFLSQPDEKTTYKLPPEISFSYNATSNITTVNINALAISNPLGGSIVGGNSPIQIKTTLVKNQPFPYAHGTANTKWIRIGVDTSDNQARAMWKDYFNYTARAAFLPNTVTGNTSTESYIYIYGSDTSPSKMPDINVIASDATYSATIYGVGG
jgi:hypothetical protein